MKAVNALTITDITVWNFHICNESRAIFSDNALQYNQVTDLIVFSFDCKFSVSQNGFLD